MPTIVIHVRDMREGDVYIGRYVGRGKRKFAASIWQNPPDIGKIGKHGTREEVIAKFEAYLKTRPDLLARVHELKGKRLACWCKPKACHGDALAKLADAS